MELRRFNEQGLEQFRQYLESLESNPGASPPIHLLTDSNFTVVLPPVDIDQNRRLDNRYEAAKYLFTLLKDLPDVDRDKRLWAWLSLLYFDQLCPADEKGQRKPGELARWIPEPGDYRHYYRHLLLGPYLIYKAHQDDPERAMLLLCGPLDEPGDIVEQIASRQELVTNKEIMKALSILYYDPQAKKPKTGAAAKGGQGTVRRFVHFLNQIDRTYDLYSLPAEKLIEMLPDEFSRFKPPSPSTTQNPDASQPANGVRPVRQSAEEIESGDEQASSRL